MELQYHNGFGNIIQSEALTGALPRHQNSPQQVPFGLYAEQLSGSAFTAPRATNLKSWLYKIQPASVHLPFKKMDRMWTGSDPKDAVSNPNQLRWSPLAKSPSSEFWHSLVTYVRNGSHSDLKGIAIHLFRATKSDTKIVFFNSDADMFFVPQLGSIDIFTECGRMVATPGEIAIVPRGMKFSVQLANDCKEIAGYVCENFGSPFRLPELGPIGANGLANPRDFEIPKAAYISEDRSDANPNSQMGTSKNGPVQLIQKYGDEFWATDMKYSPLDVVAWAGNYYPYKYDLRKFNTINSVSFDHPDPSIFTVLTSPTSEPGVANCDFAIFPDRWMVAEHTFRPPYYHRNLMSEFMGLIYGVYDAKPNGFNPLGASVHNAFSGHGPDAETFVKASASDLKPDRYEKTMAFMFESRFPFMPTKYALERTEIQKKYFECWSGLKRNFSA